MGQTRGEEVRDADRVRTGCRRIAREIWVLAYSQNTEGDRQTDIVSIRD